MGNLGVTCSATPSVVVDRTDPEISSDVTPEPNANGWNSTGTVTVSFTGTDSGSGLVSTTPDVVISSEGAGQTVTGTAIDAAGNTASVEVTVNIDTTTPVVTITSPVNGSTTAEETVTLQANLSDSLSGLGEVRVIHNGVVVETQALGGVASFNLSTPITLADDENTIAVEADDLADNSASDAITVTQVCGGTPPDVIVFADSNLEAAVRLRLGKPTGDFTPSDIPLLTSLNASSKGITDLSGLEWFTDLTNVSLHSNQISDLTPSEMSDQPAIVGPALQRPDHRRQPTGRDDRDGDPVPDAKQDQRYLPAISGLTKITVLTLYSNKIGELNDLSGMTGLAHLNAHSNQISDISGLGGVSTTMRVLDLRYNDLIVDVSPLAGMTEMVTLYLTRSKISDISTSPVWRS